MRIAILVALSLCGAGCTNDSNFSLEEEVAIILEFLESGTGVSTPGFVIAIEIRSPELSKMVFDRATNSGLNIVEPSRFRVSTGHLIRLEEPKWEGNEITLRNELVGESSIWSTAHFVESKENYELIISYAEGNASEWVPAAYANESL